MTTTHDHIKMKLVSGRWLWCLAGAVVFTVGSLNGVIPPDDTIKILLVIATFYFSISRSDNSDNGNGGNGNG